VAGRAIAGDHECMTSRAFVQVDVFSATPLRGNPLAVVLDGDGLSTEQMQRFANWTNLSETTFVLPPTTPSADYRVRIFTPSEELPFAGHPTIGTCHAWLSGNPQHAGDTVVQECGAGLITLRRTGDRLAFAAPPLLRDEPVEEELQVRIARGLGIERAAIRDARWVDNGPGWVAVLLDSAQAVLDLRPVAVDSALGVVGPYPAGAPEAVEVRAFFPMAGATVEDPVTGSLNAGLALWLLRTGRVQAPYVASQGTALGREGRVYVDQDADGAVWVGGHAVTCVRGEVEI
jgi:PhzF family phenazine biosynthesis protein